MWQKPSVDPNNNSEQQNDVPSPTRVIKSQAAQAMPRGSRGSQQRAPPECPHPTDPVLVRGASQGGVEAQV